MKLSLPAHIQSQIDDRVNSGQYHSAEEVIAAAVSTLAQQEALGDFSPGELDALLERGEKAIKNGDVMNGDDAFKELRRRRGLRNGKPV